MKQLPVSAVGAVGVVAGCAGMASMLPGIAAGALGAVGITGSGVLARTLSPIAEPLFIGSAVLVILGALACSRLVAALGIGGSVLRYRSMFQLASGGHAGPSSMATMTSAHQHTALHAEPASFYWGLSLLVVAFGLSTRRRHRHECRPLLRPLPLFARQ